MTDYAHILKQIHEELEPYRLLGEQASYIPSLKGVDPDQFGMFLTLTDGREFHTGDVDTRFSIQSISKVFALMIALSFEGKELWKRVGVEPSGSAFNSLVQLEYEHGIPRNPFINAGALVIADVLLSHLDDAEEFFLRFVRELASDQSIEYNPQTALSEQSCSYQNTAIANLLKSHGNIHNDLQKVLHLYCTMCSLEMSCRQLSKAFMNLALSDRPLNICGIELSMSRIKRINAIMLSCGFYDESGEFAFQVGLPGKSGVGGGIAAIYPAHYSVAVWSPRLNRKGNSVMGMKALELFTTYTEESIF